MGFLSFLCVGVVASMFCRVRAVYLVVTLAVGALVRGHPFERTLPTAVLDQATVTGIPGGLVNSFLGIPFAQPP